MGIQAKNGAVIVYSDTKMPKIFSLFSLPEIKGEKSIKIDEQSYNIYIIEYPVVGDDAENKRKNKQLLKFKRDLSLGYAVVRKKEAANQPITTSRIVRINNEQFNPDKEVEAIKAFAALKKYSSFIEKDIFRGSFAFLSKTINEQLIDILSEEASNIIIYETSELNTKQKNTLYAELMNKKGISIVYSKDIQKIIKNSDVLLIDKTLDLDNYSALMRNKIIYGDNSVDGNFTKIEDVILSDSAVESFENENIEMYFQNEILAVLRYFYKHITIPEFTLLFPFTYLYNSRFKWNMLYYCK